MALVLHFVVTNDKIEGEKRNQQDVSATQVGGEMDINYRHVMLATYVNVEYSDVLTFLWYWWKDLVSP